MTDPVRRPSSPTRSFGFGAVLRRTLLCAVAAVGVSSIAWAAEDPSLTAAEYEALGVPAADRTWGATEYEAAVRALTMLVVSHPERLPRRGSSKSGAVFERIVDPANLTAITQASLPIETRVTMGRNVVVHQLEILALYQSAEDKFAGAEIADLFGVELRGTTAVTLLVQEWVMGTPLSDPNRDAKIEGSERLKAKLGIILAGVLQSLVAQGNVQPSDRLRLAGTVEELWPVLYPLVPQNGRKELPGALRKLIDGDSEPELKEVLKRLLAKSGG
jgi:hypothetical protein